MTAKICSLATEQCADLKLIIWYKYNLKYALKAMSDEIMNDKLVSYDIMSDGPTANVLKPIIKNVKT